MTTKFNSFVALERKEFVKCLGVLIDKNLTWKYHITILH